MDGVHIDKSNRPKTYGTLPKVFYPVILWGMNNTQRLPQK